MRGDSYIKRWQVEKDDLGLINSVPQGYLLKPDLLTRFESVGDNCEFGFVQRFHGAEPSSLFRWATAPIEGVIAGLKDQWEHIFLDENMRPWAYDMAWDDRYRCAFHGEIRCAPNDEGHMQFAMEGEERQRALAADRSKIRFLRDKTLKCLRDEDKIYVVKANAGLTIEQIFELKAALDLYGDHKLLAVVQKDQIEWEGLTLVAPNLKVATISQLASYSQVELAAYGEWTNLLQAAVDTPWKKVPWYRFW